MQVYPAKDISVSFSLKHVVSEIATKIKENAGKLRKIYSEFRTNGIKPQFEDYYLNVNLALTPRVWGSKLNSLLTVNSGFQSMEKFNGIAGIL